MTDSTTKRANTSQKRPSDNYLTIMTNSTTKRASTSQKRPSASSSTTDQEDSPTLEELQKRNEELERRLRKYKEKQKSTRATIKPIIRPKGEAGSRRRGFILYDAMGMNKVENGPVVYDRMRDSVRKACIKVGLNLGAHYKHQDHEKLGQVFHLVRKTYPYLTTDRFPHNWAIADMVKGYIAGTRKEHNRQTREDEAERTEAREKKTTHSTTTKPNKSSTGTDSDSDDERPHSKPATTITMSKKRSRSDSIDNSDLEEDSHHKASTRKSASSNTDARSSKNSKRPKPHTDIHETNGPEDLDSDDNDDEEDDE